MEKGFNPYFTGSTTSTVASVACYRVAVTRVSILILLEVPLQQHPSSHLVMAI